MSDTHVQNSAGVHTPTTPTVATTEADLCEHLGLVEELDHDISADDERLAEHHQQRQVALLETVVDRRPVMLYLLVTHDEQRT